MDIFTAMFKRNVSIFEKMMTRLVITIVTELDERFINETRNEQCSMTYLHRTNKQFAHFPSVLYATNVKFHRANRPQGNLQESKFYYSGKSRLYDYKNEVSVSPSGFAIHANRHQPGSRADISIFHAGKE